MIKNIPSRMQLPKLEALIASRGFSKVEGDATESLLSYDFIKLVLDKVSAS